jgi:hypothetical protein
MRLKYLHRALAEDFRPALESHGPSPVWLVDRKNNIPCSTTPLAILKSTQSDSGMKLLLGIVSTVAIVVGPILALYIQARLIDGGLDGLRRRM